MKYPDRFLAAAGGFGGLVLGVSQFDLPSGLALGLLVALFTLITARISPPDDVALGPHQ